MWRAKWVLLEGAACYVGVAVFWVRRDRMAKTATLPVFEPPGREDQEEIRSQSQKLAANGLIGALLASLLEPVMILNGKGQIVLANNQLAVTLNRPLESLLGLRPGEALSCIHSAEGPAGCGTTHFCQFCGAARAAVNSQRPGEPEVEEFRIQRVVEGQSTALDLRVWATPLVVDGESFTVFALRDTTDEKRRQVLERVFFHDVLNTAWALRELAGFLPESADEEAARVRRRVHELAEEMIEEIQSQRDLTAAEGGDLTVRPKMLDGEQLLRRICALYQPRSALEGKTLTISQSAKPVMLQSDERLLTRVLGNLIKNALEASRRGSTVTVSVHNRGTPTFCVHNESAMSEEVQAQMFQRSFTTKEGVGHGVGTYSVKLLTEHYLQGTVDFRSTVQDGTTFTVRLPQRLSEAPALEVEPHMRSTGEEE
jgi:signal transduction histidine kinase